MRWTVELSDPSWLDDEVIAILRRHGAALCIHDLLEDHPWIRTTDWVYARFHGPAALENKYHGRYGPHRLDAAASILGDWLVDGHDVFAYFNNDYEGHAVADALWLKARLQRAATTRPTADSPRERTVLPTVR